MPGRRVNNATETFALPFMVSNVLALPPGADGRRRLLVTAIHHTYYPTQVALLSPEGKLLREYWHAGHLHLAKHHRRQGRNLILLGGTNTTSHQGTLVVLDPETMTGASQERAEVQLAGFAPGNEVARWLFPRSCLNREVNWMNSVTGVQHTADGLWVAVAENSDQAGTPSSSIDHHFNDAIEFQQSVPSGVFIHEHQRLRRDGRLGHDLNDDEIMRLAPVRIHGAPAAAID